MHSTQDEFHHCPACGRRTRHRASRDRKLAPVLWCQTCFHVHMEGDAHGAEPGAREQAA
jgi:uncharacterized Zn finger protein